MIESQPTPETEVSAIRTGAPAQRALAGAGIVTLSDLAKSPKSELAKLHGMGPSALSKLEAALAEADLDFAPESL
jgi:hypothetical protein